MPKAYWVSAYRKIHDPEKLAAYAKLASPSIQANGGRFLARGTAVKAYEQGVAQRTVLVEFDSVEQAIACHDSPLLTDHSFHNLGVPPRADETSPDDGRRDGARTVLKDEFNCTGAFSDDASGCRELHYLDPTFPDFDGAFRTPSLREVALTAPYMHAGQFATLTDVLHFYNTLPGTPQLGHRELTLVPLALTDSELDALIAFLESLNGDALPSELLKAP